MADNNIPVFDDMEHRTLSTPPEVSEFAEYILAQANIMQQQGWDSNARHLRKWAFELREPSADSTLRMRRHI